MKPVSTRRPAAYALQFTAFLLVFLLLFSCVSTIFRDKRYARPLCLYAEPRNSVDVLFMGSSHMLNAVSPMQLWAEQGIVSLNYAQNGQVLPVSYYSLQEALRYQKPKLVVLDIYKVIQDSLIDSNVSFHFTMDHMTFGLPKIKAAFDLVDHGERLEYLADLVLYHSRWSELTEEDFRTPVFVEKGAETLFHTQDHTGFEVFPADAKSPPAPVALDYLKRIVDLCREERIELLLVAVPFTTREGDTLNRQQVVNAMADYAEEWNVPYLNMMHELDALNFSFTTDIADEHVNWLGMGKTTSFLGEYIMDHYDIPDHREDSAYASWHDAYKDYDAYMKSHIPA